MEKLEIDWKCNEKGVSIIWVSGKKKKVVKIMICLIF